METEGQTGVAKTEFEELFTSEKMRGTVHQDFVFAQELGQRSFSMVLLQVDSEYFLLANGCTEAESIVQNIQKVVGK